MLTWNIKYNFWLYGMLSILVMECSSITRWRGCICLLDILSQTVGSDTVIKPSTIHAIATVLFGAGRTTAGCVVAALRDGWSVLLTPCLRWPATLSRSWFGRRYQSLNVIWPSVLARGTFHGISLVSSKTFLALDVIWLIPSCCANVQNSQQNMGWIHREAWIAFRESYS